MDDDLRADGWKTPKDVVPDPPEGSVAARWPGYVGDLKRDSEPVLSLGIPALDDLGLLRPTNQKVVVVALPWEPAGETPFVVAQALAKQGASPLCVCPSWSPHWDGALKVDRPAGLPGIDYFGRLKLKVGGGQPVVIDQFSRLHWDAVSSHADREEVIAEAGRPLHWLSWERQAPVIVFIRRRTRNVVRMSVDDLRSDGALEYHADSLVMVDPRPETATADLLVVKYRNGPTGLREGVPWPVLPRTVYRRVSH